MALRSRHTVATDSASVHMPHGNDFERATVGVVARFAIAAVGTGL